VPEHLEALDRLGPTVHHRRLFAPVVAARERHQATIGATGIIDVQVSETVEVSAGI
jgi:ribonuclease HII